MVETIVGGMLATILVAAIWRANVAVRASALTVLVGLAVLLFLFERGLVRVATPEGGVSDSLQVDDQPRVAQDREEEQLNIIVFNGTRTEPLRNARGGFTYDPEFHWTVNELKRVLDHCSIDARDYWINRRVRQTTEVFYNSPGDEDAARTIEDLLPGNQRVASLNDDSSLWGMHADRDIVMIIGRDAWYIRELLQVEDDIPCPFPGSY